MSERKDRWVFWVGAGIFCLAFLITRLPYFLYYGTTVVNRDSSGYFMIVDQMNKGFWPNLSIRTIGYPLFLKVVDALSSTSFAVAVAQHALTLITRLFFIWAMARAFPRRRLLPVLVALGLAAHAAISWQVLSDSSYMTDSLFISAVITTLGLLVLALARRKKFLFICMSLAAAAAVLIRPAGLFLLPVLALAVIFMARGRFGRGPLLAALLPCAAVLLCQMAYNALTIRSFTLSAFSEHALISLTSTFLEPDPAYGQTANTAIERCRAAVTKKDRRVLEDSWNPWAINRVFRRYYEANRSRFSDAFLAAEAPDAYNLYIGWRPLWRRVAEDALRKHPGTALKYVFSSLYKVFILNLWGDVDLYKTLTLHNRDDLARLRMVREFGNPEGSFNRRFNTRAYSMTLTPDGFGRAMLPELFNRDGSPRALNAARSRRSGEVSPPLERLHQKLMSIHRPLLRHPLWSLVLLAAWVFSLIRIVRTRLRHRGAFTLFSLTSAALVYGLLVALLAYPYLRYTFALEYIYYLSPLLWPLALGLEEGARQAAG